MILCHAKVSSFASSTPQAYCTQQVLGLRLDLKKEAVKYHEVSTGEQEASKHSKNFDQLLKAVQFFPSPSEQVEVSFAEEAPLSKSQPDDVDTDDSGSFDDVGAIRLGKKRKKPYNASRLRHSQKNEPLPNNYLHQSQIPKNSEVPSQEFTRELCRSLTYDALQIVEAHPRDQTRSSTVCSVSR